MAKFGYRSQRRMEPRAGRSYATVYYQQSPQEYGRVQSHVAQVILSVGQRALVEPELMALLEQPQQRRREQAGHYTGVDIMADLQRQISLGRDVPQAMLMRWNRFFDGIAEYQIHMVLESELPPPNQFSQLFRS